ncbi:MAG: cell division protein FtsX [Myxococcota bacterium]
MTNDLSPTRIALYLREAWSNILGSPLLTLVAVLTIAVSLILVGFFGTLLVNANHILDAMAQDLRITVYLDPSIDAASVNALQERIATRDEVAQTAFLSADDDRQRNRELLDAELLKGLDQDAIPGQPAIEIQLEPRQRTKEDFTRITEWVGELAGVDGVQELYFGADKIRVLFAVIDLLRVIGFIICVIIVAAAVFFTFSTIKLAVYSRKEEIEVLRLVGATSTFIRTPFYLEGAFAGLLGTLTALIIVAFIHSRLIAFVEEEHLLNVRFDLLPAGMLAWFLVGGVALGLAGSALSVRRHLKD